MKGTMPTAWIRKDVFVRARRSSDQLQTTYAQAAAPRTFGIEESRLTERQWPINGGLPSS